MKASQCFTKYKWRDSAAAQRESGPQIVATQVSALDHESTIAMHIAFLLGTSTLGSVRSIP